MHDYLVVGSGVFGSVFAQQMKEKGKDVLVIEKRPHIGGNCYTENINNIHVHKYGPHIFHTNLDEVWDYINQFTKFNNYQHTAKVLHKGKIFSFPINLMTLYQLWGVKTPEEAKAKIERCIVPNPHPQNIEEWCLSKIGKELYETFIRDYTFKQWGKHPKELPCSIISRIPIRYNYDDNYYHTAKYQGIPLNGYTKIIENMLDGVKVEVGVDFESIKNSWRKYAKKLIYTGPIDAFYDYEFGELEYRSLKWENHHSTGDVQGCSALHHTDLSRPFTRSIEHKHFNPEIQTNHTIVSYEYPVDWKETKDPYYPINDEKNNNLFHKYQNIKEKDVTISGRLGIYKYLDMDTTISLALKTAKNEI